MKQATNQNDYPAKRFECIMRVLFTVHMFKGFTGSELVTLDQARFFYSKGYEVDIFTLEKTGAITEYIPSYIRVIDVPDVSKLRHYYDLIISRQWPLLEYLLFARGIDAKRVYYECVSWCLPIDFYPYFYNELTLCGYISERIQKKLNSMGYDTSNSFRFSNYTRKEFIEYGEALEKERREKSTQTPRKIAIVSNHAPNELESAAAILRSKHDIAVDLYGMHHNYKLITPEILGQYDVIVSIGKTIFFSLSMGIPSYLYDQTCSIGYVSADNYEDCVAGNMAGSDGYEKRDPKVLANEILSGYESALSQAGELIKRLKRDFVFEDRMESLLAELMSKPEMDMALLRKKYPYAQHLSPVFINEADFDRRDIIRWYDAAMGMKALLEESEKNREELLNSRGWRFLEMLRKPLHLLKGIRRKES